MCNLQFDNSINLMGRGIGELQDLSNRLVDRTTASYGMDVSTEKSKIISAYIGMIGQKLEELTSFKYLGETLCKDGTCKADVCVRIASAMEATARLSRIWRCNTISFANKFKRYQSLFISIIPYGWETWTLITDSERRIQAFETNCLRKRLRTQNTRSTTGCRARSFSFWVHRNLVWQLSRDRKFHGSNMSHVTAASPKPSFKASQMPPAEKTGRGSLLNRPLCPPPPTTQSVKGLNRTELIFRQPWCTLPYPKTTYPRHLTIVGWEMMEIAPSECAWASSALSWNPQAALHDGSGEQGQETSSVRYKWLRWLLLWRCELAL